MKTVLLILLTQGALGAFDTLYYHEYKLRLPQQPHASRELRLHALRDFIYALIFGTLGWLTWQGLLAWLLLALLLVEIGLTLADFLEEDRTRKLPPGERAMHALMGILYGIFLAQLFSPLLRWSHQATGFGPAHYGWISWAMPLLALGVLLSGLRDLHSSARKEPNDG